MKRKRSIRTHPSTRPTLPGHAAKPLRKYQFFLQAPDGMSTEAFRSAALGNFASALLATAPAGLKVALVHPKLRYPRLIPFRRRPSALISLYDRKPALRPPLLAFLSKQGIPFHAYRVSETVPRNLLGRPKKGVATRGVLMLTLFRRRKNVSKEAFFRHWHEGHAPIALGYHPTVRYIRNAVENVLTPSAPPWAGIVEETFPDNETLCSLPRFVGGGTWWKVVPRLIHILVQTRSFLDLFTLENHLYEEFWLKTPSARR